MTVTVLSPEMEQLGLINQLTAISWTQRKIELGSFELWCPLIEENSSLLQRDNLVWLGGDSLAVIEVVQKKMGEEGATLQVSGRFIECWLERRIVWDKFLATDFVSTLLRKLVQDNVISPTLPQRKLPFIALQGEQKVLGQKVSFSANKDNLLSALTELSEANSLMVRLHSGLPNGKKALYFSVSEGTNRSLEQTAIPAVVLSTELSDLLSDVYTSDATACKTMTVVAGSGEGDKRKTLILEGDRAGVDRRELYTDARDLLSTEDWKVSTTVTTFILDATTHNVEVTTKATKTNPRTGETTTTTTTITHIDPNAKAGVATTESTEAVPLPEGMYDSVLKQRGMAKLKESSLIESFDIKLRVLGETAYTYGEDYFIGDRITIEDKVLSLQVSTEVTEAQQIWDEEGYSVVLTLGSAAPTITQLINRKG